VVVYEPVGGGGDEYYPVAVPSSSLDLKVVLRVRRARSVRFDLAVVVYTVDRRGKRPRGFRCTAADVIAETRPSWIV
jgi:hypothetical protein